MITVTVTNCKYCHNEIEWEKENGKYIPYNIDGTRHTRQQCEQMKKLASASVSQGNGIGSIEQMITKLLDGKNEDICRVGEYEIIVRKVM